MEVTVYECSNVTNQNRETGHTEAVDDRLNAMLSI